MKKIAFLFLTLALCALSFTACDGDPADTTTIATYPQSNPASDFVFEESENGVNLFVKRYIGTDSIAVIPAEVDEKPVVSIDSFSNEEVEVLWVPDSVKNLLRLGFCPSLREVHLGKGLKYIYAEAFSGCDSLETIVIPEGVETIVSHAFSGCESLRSVTFPSTVTKMGSEMFLFSPAIEEVIFQEGIEKVGGYAFFWGCESLHELTFPKSVKYVGECTLANSGVTKVTFLGDAPEFGDGALETRMGNLTVYYPKDAKGWENLSFENVTFVPY